MASNRSSRTALRLLRRPGGQVPDQVAAPCRADQPAPVLQELPRQPAVDGAAVGPLGPFLASHERVAVVGITDAVRHEHLLAVLPVLRLAAQGINRAQVGNHVGVLVVQAVILLVLERFRISGEHPLAVGVLLRDGNTQRLRHPLVHGRFELRKLVLEFLAGLEHGLEMVNVLLVPQRAGMALTPTRLAEDLDLAHGRRGKGGGNGSPQRHRLIAFDRFGCLRIGERITVAAWKGTVPFSSNENWDSPRVIDSPILSGRRFRRPGLPARRHHARLHRRLPWGSSRDQSDHQHCRQVPHCHSPSL